MGIATLQGMYYLITGLWSVIHIASFEKVTGRKTDKWLVKAMGLMFASVGTVLIVTDSPHVHLLAILVAASTLFIDVYYSVMGVISKVYLADGAVHVLFLIAWAVYYIAP